MSTAPPPAIPAVPPAPPAEKDEVVVVSHSNLFYWWPVWAVGFLMGILTLIDRHFMVVVPSRAQIAYDASVTLPPDKNGEQRTLAKREVVILPEPSAKMKDKGERFLPRKDALDAQSEPALLKLHVASTSSYGVLFATVLLLVIVITNVPLRGMWSVMVITLIILLSVIFGLAGWWDDILRTLSLLDIRINAAGYFTISGVLFGIWLVTIMFFDRNIYMVFTPGQFKVCQEIGGGEKVHDAMGLSLEKQRSDLFRHWILGLGSGDLVVRTSGAKSEHFDLPNVLFIGKKVRQIEQLMKRRQVIETKH